MTASVCHDVLLHCLAPSGRRTTLAATLAYADLDPYAVRVVFHGPRDDIAWLVDREVLMAGRHRPAGEGDVMVRPDARDTVAVRFSSPQGSLETWLPRCHLDSFLAATLELVPLGTESVDADDLLVALLASD
jgi:hypothetical protein